LKTLSRFAAGCGLAAASTLAAAATELAMPMISTLVSLVLVLAAIGATAFLVKRLGPGNAQQVRLMRVVSQLPLGAREKISIVELDDQWLVLGVTAQQITLLAQTPRKEGGAPPLPSASFSKLFNLATLSIKARGKHVAT
jgi:flagellar protein FliO/FliZ